MKYVVLGLATCCFAAAARAQAESPLVRVTVADVQDTRSTSQFFAKCELELLAVGDVLADAERFRARVGQAVDETGRNLVQDEKDSLKFAKLDRKRAGQAEIDVALKNPSRRALTIQELAGHLDIYVPKRDPNATGTLANFAQHTGKPITTPTLKTAGVRLTFMTKEEYEAIKAQKEREARAAAEDDLGEAMGQALAEAFSGLFAGFTTIGPNSVILKLEDPASRVIGIEFQDAQGTELTTRSRMTMGDVRVYGFQTTPPEDARVKLYLATDKAMLHVPFRLTNIPLP